MKQIFTFFHLKCPYLKKLLNYFQVSISNFVFKTILKGMKDDIILCPQYITIIACGPRPSIKEQGKCLRESCGETKTLEHVQICIDNLLRRYSKEWYMAKVIVDEIHHHFCIMTVPVDKLPKTNCSSNTFLPKKTQI